MRFYQIRTFAQNEMLMQDEKIACVIFYVGYFFVILIWTISDH